VCSAGAVETWYVGQTAMLPRFRSRGVWLGSVAGALAIGGLAWTFYYKRAGHCPSGPTPGCARFVVLESMACDHGLPGSLLLGSCARVGARYLEGDGVTKDVAQAITYLRRACVGSISNDGACVLAWSYYLDGFSSPHYVLGWSGHFSGRTYTPNWGRELRLVQIEAESLCANADTSHELPVDRRGLVLRFCQTLSQSRLAEDDAARHVPELLQLCEAGRKGACLLGGTAVALGLGAPPDYARGRALMRRACDLGCSVDCDELRKDGTRGSTVLDLAERVRAARVGEEGPP
jgi:hypothetical protein